MKFLQILFILFLLPSLLNGQDYFEPLGGPLSLNVLSSFKDVNGILYIQSYNDSSLIHFKSNDHGDTWTPVVINDSIQIAKLYADEIPNLFAIDNNGVLYRSDENGGNWEVILIGGNPPILTDLSISPDGDIFYNNYEGLRVSGDKGNSWTLLYDEKFLWKVIEFHPNGDMYCLISVDGISLGRSTDGGSTWGKIYSTPNIGPSRINGVHISNEGVIYLRHETFGDLFPDEVYSISYDEGFSFEPIADPNTLSSFITTNNSGDILYSDVTEIFLSKDQGQNWQDISAGLPEGFEINHIYVDTDQYIYLSLQNNVLYKSIVPSDEITSTSELPKEASNTKAYPNPFGGSFEIKLEKVYSEGLAFQLRDAQGRLVVERFFTGDYLNVKTGGLPEGVYFYQVTLRGEIVGVGKVVKRGKM